MEYEGGGPEGGEEGGGGRATGLPGWGGWGAGGVLRTCPVVGSKNPPRGF